MSADRQIGATESPDVFAEHVMGRVDRAAVVTAVRAGASYAEAARRFGCSIDTTYRIVRADAPDLVSERADEPDADRVAPSCAPA